MRAAVKRGGTRLSGSPARLVKIGAEGRQNGGGAAPGYYLRSFATAHEESKMIAQRPPSSLFSSPRPPSSSKAPSRPSSALHRVRKAAPTIFSTTTLLSPTTALRHHARAHSRDTTTTLCPRANSRLAGARACSHQPTYPPTRSYRLYPHPRSHPLAID